LGSPFVRRFFFQAKSRALLDYFSAQANAQGDFLFFFGSEIEKPIGPKIGSGDRRRRKDVERYSAESPSI
jgi:hypothetical protein